MLVSAKPSAATPQTASHADPQDPSAPANTAASRSAFTKLREKKKATKSSCFPPSWKASGLCRIILKR
ncbi:MAG TPA: hypothetical protein PKZ53_03540, partial [Acidobacteriota bacterium]|nr:hypothetical protein [Acidobacteriota bacterium]